MKNGHSIVGRARQQVSPRFSELFLDLTRVFTPAEGEIDSLAII
jgi:hypothetical protein